MKRQLQSARGSRKQALIEWTVIALMVALCGGLAGLQYHWTGEVGSAEVTRLRASLEDQVKNFGREFDAELMQAYEALFPSSREVESEGADAAYGERFREWIAESPRAAFSRIAIAVPTNGTLNLFELDQKQVRFVAAGWPSSWSALQQNLSQKMRGAGGPGRPGGAIFTDPIGRLVEFPIFGGTSSRPGPPESQWAIFELDMNYVTNKWMPELVSRYFSFTGKLVHDIVVKQASDTNTVLFSTAPNSGGTDGTTTLAFNPQFRLGPLRESKGEGRWIIEARHRPDAFDTIVAASRRRNLGLAVLLNGLMLTAGIFLVRYTRRSRELAERQMQFVANVSHELRTPLTVIQGAGENLARGIARDPEAVNDYAQLILQHSKQLKATVEQVLTFATAKGRLPFASRQSIAIGQILGEAVSATREETEAAECEVDLELPPDLPAVRGDALALGRTFQNLISNAAKHGADGKWIGITARYVEAERNTVEVQIADRGPGIPKQEQERIFMPFVRAAQADEQAVRGSGLGLSIVREIVEAHGGTVSVQSGPGRGAIFIVRLPAEEHFS